MSEDGQYILAASEQPLVRGNNGFTAKGIGALSNNSGSTFTAVPFDPNPVPNPGAYRSCAVSGSK